MSHILVVMPVVLKPHVFLISWTLIDHKVEMPEVAGVPGITITMLSAVTRGRSPPWIELTSESINYMSLVVAAQWAQGGVQRSSKRHLDIDAEAEESEAEGAGESEADVGEGGEAEGIDGGEVEEQAPEEAQGASGGGEGGADENAA